MPHAIPLPKPAAGPAPPQRLPALDVLRTLAVLLVLGRHAEPDLAHFPGPLAAVMAAWQCGGWVGVDLFFVLSGFLVSGLLFREHQRFGRVQAGAFLVRRGLKIYPAFYALLAVTVVSRVWKHGGSEELWNGALAEALFVQNYFPGLWNHTWSLAVEEHFYLGCALVFALLARRNSHGGNPFRWFPAVVVAVGLLLLGARMVLGVVRPYNQQTHLFPTHLRLDGLLFGAFLSYVFHHHRDVLERLVGKRPWKWVLAAVLLLAPAFIFRLEETYLVSSAGLTVFYLASGVLVTVAAVRGFPNHPAFRFLAWVGSYSYSIYLWHMFVRFRVEALVRSAGQDPQAPLGILLYLVACIPAGILMARLIEVPVLRLRDRLLPSRAGALVVAPGTGTGVAAPEQAPTAPAARDVA